MLSFMQHVFVFYAHRRAGLSGAFAVARCCVNVLHGNLFAFMLMYLLCEELHTGAPPFIKEGLFKALSFSTGKEGLKQECFDTSVIALCFKGECRMNMYDV